MRYFVLFCLLASPAYAQKDRPKWANTPTPTPIVEIEPVIEPEPIREVLASPRKLITLNTRMRYTTLVLLPEGDEVMEVNSGDAGQWVTTASMHMVSVKPTDAGLKTNMNVVTASGAVYSFLLQETSKGTPDLKVYVKAAEQSPAPVVRKYVSAAQLEAVNEQLLAAHAAMDAERAKADEKIEEFKRQFPTQLNFDYHFTPVNTKPFYVKAIWNDGRHTFVQTDVSELPIIYEVKDDRPSIVNFEVSNGIYVVPKVLDKAYLAIGKKKFYFTQREVKKAN